MKRLISGVVTTGLVFGIATAYIDTEVSPATPSVVLLAGVTGAALAATMIHSTRHWSLRAVGLFLYLAGVALLLIATVVNYRTGLSPETIEVLNDLILSCWIVGCPLALMGVVLYVIGGDRPPQTPEEHA